MGYNAMLFVLAATLLLVCTELATCQVIDVNCPLKDAWKVRHEIVMKFRRFNYCTRNLAREKGAELRTCFTSEPDEIMRPLEKFFLKSNPSEVTGRYCLIDIRSEFTGATHDLFKRTLVIPDLDELHKNTLGKLEKVFEKHIDKVIPKVHNAKELTLPTAQACNDIPIDSIIDVSVKKICPTLDSCTQSPYSSSTNGCTPDNKCDITKAIPLMLGVLFYKISFAFVDKFCTSEPQVTRKMKENLNRIEEELQMFKTFIIMHNKQEPFDLLYRKAIANGIFSDVNNAMRFITENLPFFSMAPTACQKIGLKEACGSIGVYDQYILLRKMQKKHEREELDKRRDLRLFRKIDHQAFIAFMRSSLDKFEILASIDSLDENLMAQTGQISSYFQGVADYDQQIAQGDVAFIRDKLKEFDSQYKELTAKMEKDLHAIMISTNVALALTLAEQIGRMVALVVQNANPFKLAFSGLDAKEMMEQSAVVTQAIADQTKAGTLSVAINTLSQDTIEFGNKLYENAQQLTAMQSVVKKITENRADEIEQDVDLFLKQYNDYTPKVDSSLLARNIEKWTMFQEALCGLLEDADSVTGQITRAVIVGMSLCEEVQALMAELGALREDIFDFQFDLVDSLAAVIKGNLAKKTAQRIGSGQVDTLRADKLFSGYLMAENRIQQHAWVFCDKVMYKNHGKSNEICSPVDGLFGLKDLANIASYRDNIHYTTFDRTVYIPSKPQFPGDTGFLSIPTLMEKKKVSFRLPRKAEWLSDFNWADTTKVTSALYIKSFHLFLVNKEYTKEADRMHKTYSLKVRADPGSFVSIDSDVSYLLPKSHSTYNTEYVEGYGSCTNEIDNPYSLCDNLPKICLTSERDSSRSTDNLMPTVFSRFTVTLNIHSGSKSLDFQDPNSLTDLRFIAKVKFAKPSSNEEDDDQIARDGNLVNDDGSGSERRQNERRKRGSGCCEGNTYRESWLTNKCIPCPNLSNSVLGGYYCEITKSK